MVAFELFHVSQLMTEIINRPRMRKMSHLQRTIIEINKKSNVSLNVFAIGQNSGGEDSAKYANLPEDDKVIIRRYYEVKEAQLKSGQHLMTRESAIQLVLQFALIVHQFFWFPVVEFNYKPLPLFHETFPVSRYFLLSTSWLQAAARMEKRTAFRIQLESLKFGL